MPGRIFGGLLIPSRPSVLSGTSASAAGSCSSAQQGTSQAPATDPAEGQVNNRSSRRRRLNSGAAQGCPRVFCPVPGCPDGDPNRAGGWSCHQHMREHLDEHCAGIYAGAVPPEYLQEHRLGQCQVCSRLLSTRFSNDHPHCRPQLSTGGHGSRNTTHQRANASSLVNFEEVFNKRVATKAGVPKEARRMWSQCLAHALSEECAVQRH